MTKGGITTFTKSMAIYFGKNKFPIRINQVHPGIIETDMGTQVYKARISQNPEMTTEGLFQLALIKHLLVVLEQLMKLLKQFYFYPLITQVL